LLPEKWMLLKRLHCNGSGFMQGGELDFLGFSGFFHSLTFSGFAFGRVSEHKTVSQH